MEEVSVKTEEEQEVKPKGKGKKLFQKGQSGNPKGRPPGSISIRDKIRQYLEKNPDEVQKIVEHFVKNNRELLWQMLEGKPKQQMEIDADKESLAELTAFFRSIAKPNDSGESKSI